MNFQSKIQFYFLFKPGRKLPLLLTYLRSWKENKFQWFLSQQSIDAYRELYRMNWISCTWKNKLLSIQKWAASEKSDRERGTGRKGEFIFFALKHSSFNNDSYSIFKISAVSDRILRKEFIKINHGLATGVRSTFMHFHLYGTTVTVRKLRNIDKI